MGGFTKGIFDAAKSLIPGVEKEAEPLLKKAGDVLEQKGEQFMKGLHDAQALNSIKKDVRYHPAASDLVGKPSVVDKGIVNKKPIFSKDLKLPLEDTKAVRSGDINFSPSTVIHTVNKGTPEEIKAYKEFEREHSKRYNEVTSKIKQLEKQVDDVYQNVLNKDFEGPKWDGKFNWTKEYLDDKAKKKAAWEQWDAYNEELYKLRKEEFDLKYNVKKPEDPRIGELRKLANGDHILWLSDTAIKKLWSALAPFNFLSDLQGVRMEKSDLPKIMSKISFWLGDPVPYLSEAANKARKGNAPYRTGLLSLLTRAMDTEGSGIVVAGIKNKGLRHAINTVREELMHDWQGNVSGTIDKHLKPEVREQLHGVIPKSIMDSLIRDGYKTSEPAITVTEAAAKIMAGNLDKEILKEPDTAAWLSLYFDAVEQEHGTKALEQIRYAIKQFARFKERYVESKRAIKELEKSATEGQ